MDGSDAISSPLVNTVEAGDTLGSFFAALHQPAPDDSPVNRFRGVPLRQRAEQLDGLLSTFVADGLVPPETRGVWDAGLEADPYGGPPLWLHGDPHSGNLLVHNDAIVSVIDWGDITSGDPASDLTCMWIALDPAGRRAARRRLGYDDDVWTRGRAWATAIGVMLLGHSDDRPEYFALGHRTIEQVLLD